MKKIVLTLALAVILSGCWTTTHHMGLDDNYQMRQESHMGNAYHRN